MYMIMTYYDEERGESVVSHAVNIDTGEVRILPDEPIESLGYYHPGCGEYILHD